MTVLYAKGASQPWMLNAAMGRETSLLHRERTGEGRGEVSGWSPCRKPVAAQGRHTLGVWPRGQPCSPTCCLDSCVKHPPCWKEGWLLPGTSPVPEQNAANFGKGKPTTLSGCACRYSARVSFPPRETSACLSSLCSQCGSVTDRRLLRSPSPQKQEQNLEPHHNLTLETASGHCVWKPSPSDLFSVTGWTYCCILYPKGEPALCLGSSSCRLPSVGRNPVKATLSGVSFHWGVDNCGRVVVGVQDCLLDLTTQSHYVQAERL